MIENRFNKILYFCVGCRQVHWDNDYCKADGDLQIMNWDRFLESIEYVKNQDSESVQKGNSEVEDDKN